MVSMSPWDIYRLFVVSKSHFLLPGLRAVALPVLSLFILFALYYLEYFMGYDSDAGVCHF